MSIRRIFSLAALITFLPFAKAMNDKPYPPTRVEKVTETLQGTEIVDAYRWLEDGNSPEVKEWTDKQNAYTRSVLGKLPGRDKIHDRLSTLLEIDTLSTPLPVKGKYFYLKREGKQNQAILYVREGLRGKDRVLIDPNALAADGTVTLDWWFPSRDGSLVAYGLSANGSELSKLHVREVATGKDLPDLIERTRACSLGWLPDNSGFYYTRYPAIGSVPKGEEAYYRQVFFHKLGGDPAKDAKVFGEGRSKEDWPNVALSPNGRWLVVTEQQGWAKSEIYFKDLKRDGARFVPLVETVDALFDVVVRDDRFYVHTNDEAPRYRLYQVDPLKPARGDWMEIIAQSDDILEGVAAIGDALVTRYMHKAASKLVLRDRDGKLLEEIKLPQIGSVAGLGGQWDGDEFLYGFQSFTRPLTVYQVDLKTRKSQLWEQVKTDIDLSAYEVEQVTYPSEDKTPVTMFLVHKKGLKKDGTNPTLLNAYGGFNIALTPTFNLSRFLFLENGGLLAIANLRGGGEYGEAWHKAGMLGKKQNVFDDYLAAAEYLIAEKYTSRDRLAIQGGSNGGLLTGAALTQRPDLFKCVVCQVPLLDMLRYHKFLIARLWIPEYGSADDPDQFKWLHAYSPYHHVKDGTAYPAVLLEAAESDTRVDPLHARKMAARLQAATSSDQPILLRVETKAGHGAGKPRAKVVEELTDVWSFVFWQLGIKCVETGVAPPEANAEAKHYKIVTLPIPKDIVLEVGGLAMRPDGKLLACTRRGDVWLISNPNADDLTQVKYKLFATGLHEALGLCLVGKDVYVVQRPELTKLVDSKGADVADEYVTVCDKWGVSGDYHEFAFGPARDKDGNFYVTLNVGFGGGHQSKAPWRGWCVKITPQGELKPFATGLRSPNGVNFSPDGDLFYTDNQGEWVATCKLVHLEEGDYEGHPAGLRWVKQSPFADTLKESYPSGMLYDGQKGSKTDGMPQHKQPAIWFPYGRMGQSASEPIWDTTGGKFGPFAGQCLVGDQTKSTVMRCYLEKINGKYQGACFPFRSGFECGINRLCFGGDGSLYVGMTNRGWGSLGGKPYGLQRLVYTGVLPFEIYQMKLTKEGFDLTFTKPLDVETAKAVKAYNLESFTHHYWSTYGSPEMDHKAEKVQGVKVSDDGKLVSLKVDGFRPGRIYELHLDGVKSADGDALLHAVGYYTLNEIPK